MAMPQPNIIENPIKLGKFRNNINNISQKRNTTRLSLWAFVFSIIMYISVFYMFNLSPYTLVSTTNFWFFISNTLILIIAADFNFGSSSSDQEYLFQEYMKNCQEKSTITTSTSTFNYSPYNAIDKMEIIIPHEEVVMITKEEEDIKDVVLVENDKQEEEIINTINEENEIYQEDKKEKSGEVECTLSKKVQADALKFPLCARSEEVKCTRSKSDLKAIIMVETNENNDEKKINNGIIQRSKSERYDFVANNGDEEINDEFSEMSVEELNRRVEEFIQRFNRQIRLQAASRKNL
ncbi:hypothetical protein P3L10_005113 [Capsicum annuum]|nr:uncharacterized protein LOC107861124 [Capsicum annuum]